MIHRLHRHGAAGLGLLFASGFLLLSPAAAIGAATPPTIKLFPTTVLEEIRRTGDVAREMESGLQGVIARLDQQQQLYRESKCDGSDGDAGCEQIARQMGATYLEMLQVMEQRLPEMEAAVDTTSRSLRKRLRRELGQKHTPWTLQELLLGKTGGEQGRAAQPHLRGRSGMRLSTRFSQYYRLVASSAGRNDSSLAVVASDIYLDMEETARLIARTREEISRATLMEQLNQSFGTITPEMQEVVAGVKSILFGEQADELPVAEKPAEAPDTEYRSPLQL
ncbi:MAG TPA: hypothetical protein ENI96_15085 [Sedimenticola thiotaurini]|uniref:Uncharacterized protein n=1 Tax=Sedimenticola thiotaurini TaxID=1543721 RepID=A0A831WA76_9GAMM|nr:hypothetical protein [Sedimenticola thiotaurini]